MYYQLPSWTGTTDPDDPLREIREAMREGNTIVVADTHEYQASITLGHNPEKKLLALQ